MRSVPLCAYCRRRPADPAWRPFCSERCKMLDLSRWLDGSYRLPGEPVATADADDDDGHETEE